jgi:2-desacetyl-2-hydroxyethyl bacteriochlorophyllide A dehydrogenase
VIASKLEKRVILTKDNEIKIKEFPIGTLNSGQVHIQTICSLISAGTELGVQGAYSEYSSSWSEFEYIVQPPAWVGSIARKVERGLGYSNVGRIVALSDDLRNTESFPFRMGDVVLSSGNHASHIVVTPENEHLTPVPQGLSSEEAAFGVLGSVSIYGIERANLRLGDHVAIVGMGVVGQLALQLARYTGCESLIAIDLETKRLEIANKAGATHTVQNSNGDLKKTIREITRGRGIDIVIEASGAASALSLAIDMARTGGKIILLGTPWSRKAEADFFKLHLKELELIGCHQPRCPKIETPYFPWTQSSNRQRILRMIHDGRLDVKRLITHRIPYFEIKEAYRLLREEKDKALGVVILWDQFD